MFSCSDDQSIKIWGSHDEYKVKIQIDSKFKVNKEDEIMSGNNSDENNINGQDDSESIGDSSISENSIVSEDEE